jgi:hypothetical protein
MKQIHDIDTLPPFFKGKGLGIGVAICISCCAAKKFSAPIYAVFARQRGL